MAYIIAALRGQFLSSGFTLGARLSLDIVGLIADIIRALDILEQQRRGSGGQP
jgi:hypothetical protein